MLGGANKVGQQLARFPHLAVPKGSTTACGKGLKVLRQLEPSHPPRAVSVGPVFALIFIWGTEGSMWKHPGERRSLANAF